MSDPASITHPWDPACPFCRDRYEEQRAAEAEAERNRRVVGDGPVIARFMDDQPPPRPAWAKE